MPKSDIPGLRKNGSERPALISLPTVGLARLPRPELRLFVTVKSVARGLEPTVGLLFGPRNLRDCGHAFP